MTKKKIFRVGLIIAIAAFALGVNGCSKKDSDKETSMVDGEESVETLEAEIIPENNIIAISEDGPMFPSLDVELPTTEAPKYYRNGDKDEEIINIQQRLMDLGYMDPDEPTAYFGNVTERSVKRFQKIHELEDDGVIGPESYEILMSENAKYYAAKKGDSGADIEGIQWRLYQLGYIASLDYVTGNFGDKTEEAVKLFQEKNKLTVDGTVGRQTQNLLYSDEVKPNLLSFGDENEIVLAAQERLFALGYLTTKPDGSYGNDTVAAIKVFQGKNGLIQDGYLGPETRDVLMSDAALPSGLGLGDEGSQVTNVQTLLAKWKYLKSSNITGYFGEMTLNAVKNFQKRNGLSPDGLVGAQTMAKLTSDKVVGPAKESTSQSSSSGGGSTSTETQAASTGGGSAAPDAGSDQGAGAAGTPNTDANGVSAAVANLLAVARSKVGCPYSYGSKGPNAFDCSGFVNYCLNQVGVNQSYITSYGWRNIGKYTRISNYADLRAGDIIVVNGHVGIISTGGYLIDASSSNGRVIERPLGSWWANHFIVGWRIF